MKHSFDLDRGELASLRTLDKNPFAASKQSSPTPRMIINPGQQRNAEPRSKPGSGCVRGLGACLERGEHSQDLPRRMSAIVSAMNKRLAIPFSVKKAMLTLDKSAGRTSLCS